MKLFTYAGNVHALQSLIIAKYNGVEIEVPAFEMGKDNKKADFLAKSPMGKVPVLETPSGCICEAAAIARCLGFPAKRFNHTFEPCIVPAPRRAP